MPTQQEAAMILSRYFYEWRSTPHGGVPDGKIAFLRSVSGAVVGPTKITRADLDAQRDRLLPRDFRFEIPLLRRDAHYI